VSRAGDVASLYETLEELARRLGGARRLDVCTARSGWPERGVYFFFETGEVRASPNAGSRVVRIGTHGLAVGSQTTLWNRLSQHRGSARSGSGNHRGSVFRLLVGEALLRRRGEKARSWGIGAGAAAAAERLGIARETVRSAERALEAEVSRTIGAMNVLWVDVPDAPGADSLRGAIERHSIALLSAALEAPVDAPSSAWLGRHSGRDAVQRSGLWNVNHVADRYDPSFLPVLHRLARLTHPRGA
jgi:hypothetical protein